MLTVDITAPVDGVLLAWGSVDALYSAPDPSDNGDFYRCELQIAGSTTLVGSLRQTVVARSNEGPDNHTAAQGNCATSGETA